MSPMLLGKISQGRYDGLGT